MAMNKKRKQRLLIVLAIVIGSSIAAALLFYALRDNLNLFYSPEAIAEGQAPTDKRIRAGGMVKEGSVKRESDGLTVHFIITDYKAELAVRFKGILPALFAENDGVVVAGILQDDGLFVADEVLAKHDENYMPPEIDEAVKKQHQEKMKQRK